MNPNVLSVGLTIHGHQTTVFSDSFRTNPLVPSPFNDCKGPPKDHQRALQLGEGQPSPEHIIAQTSNTHTQIPVLTLSSSKAFLIASIIILLLRNFKYIVKQREEISELSSFSSRQPEFQALDEISRSKP